MVLVFLLCVYVYVCAYVYISRGQRTLSFSLYCPPPYSFHFLNILFYVNWCEGVRSPRMGITDSGELPCRWWERNSGPLEEQPVLILSAEPFLQHLPQCISEYLWGLVMFITHSLYSAVDVTVCPHPPFCICSSTRSFLLVMFSADVFIFIFFQF